MCVILGSACGTDRAVHVHKRLSESGIETGWRQSFLSLGQSICPTEPGRGFCKTRSNPILARLCTRTVHLHDKKHFSVCVCVLRRWARRAAPRSAAWGRWWARFPVPPAALLLRSSECQSCAASWTWPSRPRGSSDGADGADISARSRMG